MSRAKHCAALVVCALTLGACGSESAGTPTAPTGNATLTAPAPQSPSDGEQLGTLRPTLTVLNGTSSQAGARTYEFQISDRSDFATAASTASQFFAVVVSRTGVPEGADGRTSFTPEQDLQPTTRFYWRARMLQGGSTSAWSPTRTFKSRLVGYNRAGELYDPLVHGETIGTIVGSTTFLGEKGIRLNDQNSYVRYALLETISNGEFSVEVEGLHRDGPGAKLRVLSMMDGTGDLLRSKFLLNAQYRGLNGNPPNAISFKALFGDEDYKLEPDLGQRLASVMSLDPATTYYWKATWNSEYRVTIRSGGINGNVIYDLGKVSPGGRYSPVPHFAYLGANNAPYGVEEGSWPGAIFRNVWIGNRPRPESLGSALLPR